MVRVARPAALCPGRGASGRQPIECVGDVHRWVTLAAIFNTLTEFTPSAESAEPTATRPQLCPPAAHPRLNETAPAPTTARTSVLQPHTLRRTGVRAGSNTATCARHAARPWRALRTHALARASCTPPPSVQRLPCVWGWRAPRGRQAHLHLTRTDQGSCSPVEAARQQPARKRRVQPCWRGREAVRPTRARAEDAEDSSLCRERAGVRWRLFAKCRSSS